MKKFNKSGGFTLIELLVVIGIIAILAAIVIVSINPAKRFMDARQSQRQANVESILNAIQQSIVDEDGEICTEITTTVQDISNTEADLKTCLADYLAVLPTDPQDATGDVLTSTYNTGYTVVKNAEGQVTVDAPGTEGDPISVTR